MKKHILLVDNDEGDIDIFTKALSKLPLRSNCICVKNTDHAVQLLTNYSPDFIFLDYDLPREKSLRCLQQIKTLKNVQDVPVILYANQLDEENNLKGIAMGAFACIKKSSMIGTLVIKLRELMMR
jgi:DNA-binding response OmpR family regulator